jgi:hypothetical protein
LASPPDGRTLQRQQLPRAAYENHPAFGATRLHALTPDRERSPIQKRRTRRLIA